MTDLRASTALTLSPPAAVPRAAPVAVAGGFDLKLALDRATPAVVSVTGKPVADGGKDLPVPGNGDSPDEDDPLLAWMPDGLMPLPLDTPLPARIAVGTPGAQIAAPSLPGSTDAMASDLPEAAPLALPADTALMDGDGAEPSLHTGTAARDAQAAATFSNPLRIWRDSVPAQAEPGAGGGLVAAEGRFDRIPAATPTAETRQAAAAGVSAAPSVTAMPHAPAIPSAMPGASVAPAAQAFAAALAAPLIEIQDPSAPADPAGAEALMLRSVELQRTTVQATAQADQAPLDLSRDDWTGKMIERIAAMRDGVEAADTRIRLAPENLGAMEVSIRRDGDRIQVHFTAENPATRQLLAEAAPRLAELAEARGLKLGQSSIDGGGSGERGQPQHHTHQSTPARPASVRAATGTASDERIA